jgi:hypothetical protein
MRRYGEKSFEDLFGISGKWLGLYFKILSNSRGYVWKFMKCGLILQKGRGLFVRWWGFSWFLNYFQIGNIHQLVDRGCYGSRWTEDR